MFQENAINKSDNLDQYKERISKFSGEFELGLFIHIARKSIIWIVLLFLIAYFSGVLYLRYTQSIFESTSILQVQTNTEARRMLHISDETDNANLPRVIELLRSKVFFKRVLSNLPLQYSYFSEGTFKATELYTSSPYTVELRNIHTNLNNIKTYVDFTNKSYGIINYTINEKTYYKEFDTEKWVKAPHFEFKIHVKNYTSIKKQQDIVKSNSFYFLVNDIDRIVDQYYPDITVDILNGSAGTIKITFKDLNATKAAAIVSMMVTEYDSFEVEQKGGSSGSIIEFINEQIDIVYDRLKDAENSLRDYKDKYHITENTEPSLVKSADLASDVEDQIISVEIENNYLDKILNSIANYKNIDTYTLISLLGQDSQSFGFIGNKKEKSKGDFIRENTMNSTNIEKLLLQKEEMLYSVKPESEAIKAIDFQIAIQLKVLKENIKSIKVNNLTLIDELKERLDEISGTGTGEKKSVADPLEYTRLQRSFSINEKYYMLLIEKKTENSISKAGFVSQNIVLQKGIISDTPISPNKTTIYIICMMLAILLSILIIVFRYISHDQISSINEISTQLKSSISILGMIPKSMLEIPGSQLLIDKNPKSLIAESFRSIRSNLQFISNEQGAKIIAITSTISGEGKTFVAINLAGIIAFSGKKVVLIDLDMRKPKIHIGFKADNSKGMSTLLIDKDSLEDCIQHSSLENLDFLTAGPIPPNPSELVISKKMDELLAHLKTIYDVIVIDNPPVGIVSDGIAIIHKADYPIYIFRADYSKRTFVHNVDRLYNEGKLHRLCIILNGVDVERQSYGYNYGYGYGYGYGSNYGYYDESHPGKNKKSFFRKK